MKEQMKISFHTNAFMAEIVRFHHLIHAFTSHIVRLKNGIRWLLPSLFDTSHAAIPRGVIELSETALLLNVCF